MKEVWFYTYYQYEDTGYTKPFYGPTDVIEYSNYFDTFEEAWEDREKSQFPASPVMKGYVK